MRIGIPRALIYYKLPLFWEVFFENLGFEVLLSPPTNKKIVEQGTKVADHETCFSMKVFEGHLLEIGRKVDYLFVPRIKSLRKGYFACPKFWGLPDLAKTLFPKKILEIEIDLNKKSLKESLFLFSKIFQKEILNISKAFQKAKEAENSFKEKQIFAYWQKIKSLKKKVVLLGHPYNLADEYVNLKINESLEKLGLEVITIDEVPDNFLGKILHWDFAQELLEKTKKILKDCSQLSGAIELSAFQCGCDAVLKEFIEKEFKNKKIPFLHLIVDEHTEKTGFLTRLEAFVDTLS